MVLHLPAFAQDGFIPDIVWKHKDRRRGDEQLVYAVQAVNIFSTNWYG